MSNSSFSHVSSDGKSNMVDIGAKSVSQRFALAESVVIFPKGSGEDIFAGNSPKGPIEEIVRVAGIQAAKQTANLIPMCHSLNLEKVGLDLEYSAADSAIIIRCSCETYSKTGVEMEAMVGASMAALTLYDMTKSLNKGIFIRETRLLRKSGGKSGEWTAQ